MPPTRERLAPALREGLGVVLAASCGLIALAHALAGAKRSLLLSDGDSVLLPLLLRSIERGEPFQWGMSPVLFAFPELPLYALSAAVTSGVAAALLLNGVLNVVLLYLGLRFVAGRVARVPRRAVVAALAGVAAFAVLCLLETRPGGNTGEIASLFLTTTYYSGTVLALLVAIGLVLAVVRGRARRNWPIPLSLGLLAALATFSNPLFVLWASAPIGLALVVLALVRRRVWRPAGFSAAALLVGSGLGYAMRLPLSRFLIAQQDEYFRWDGQRAGLEFLQTTLVALATTPGGAVELAAIVALAVATIATTVTVLVRRGPDAVVAARLVGTSTLVVVGVVLVVIGNVSTRYALPLLFVPLTMLVVGVASSRWLAPARNARRTALGSTDSGGSAGRRRRISVLSSTGIVAAAVLVLGVGGAAGSRVVDAAADPRVAGASCLARWAAGVDVAGAGQFWTIRGLQAYVPDAELIQVNGDLSVYPWLANLAPAETARVGWLVVADGFDENGHTDFWGGTVAALGTPRATVQCGRITIYDYRGTAAERTLTDTVRRSAAAQAALRGFGS